jgi:hypothetical protein
MEEVIAKTEPLGSRIMPAHRMGRLWKFNKDEVDEWAKAGGASIPRNSDENE